MEWQQIKHYLQNNHVYSTEIDILETKGYTDNQSLRLLNSQQLDELGITTKERKDWILFTLSQILDPAGPAHGVASAELQVVPLENPSMQQQAPVANTFVQQTIDPPIMVTTLPPLKRVVYEETFQWGVANLALAVAYGIGLVISLLIIFAANISTSAVVNMNVGVSLLLVQIFVYAFGFFVVALGICSGLCGMRRNLSWSLRIGTTALYILCLAIFTLVNVLFYIVCVIPPSYAARVTGPLASDTFKALFGVFGALGVLMFLIVGCVQPGLLLSAAIGQGVVLFKQHRQQQQQQISPMTISSHA